MIREIFANWWDAHVFEFILESCIFGCLAICAGILWLIYRKKKGGNDA